MPELPEVETLRQALVQHAIGKTVTRVQVHGRRTIRRQSQASFRRNLLGRNLRAARRKGKYLLVDLDDGQVLVVHLRMSGQLRYETNPTAVRAPHTHAVIGLSDESELRFVDPRTFGELFVTSELDDAGVPLALQGLGRDPVLEPVGGAELFAWTRRRRVALKAFLLAQRPICGIGNIYGDEICFCAHIAPTRPVGELTAGECDELAAAIATVLRAAIAGRGSTLRDARYRDLLGEVGAYQLEHRVYDRAGQRCSRCGGVIERVMIAGRSAHFCPTCQR